MPPFTRAEAFAPASMGNVGIGFDILGLAYEEPGDTVVVEHREEPGAVIGAIEGDGGILPLEPDKNTASIAANAYLRTINAKSGVSITLKKGLPLASGLGSSAASSVAAAFATNALFGEPLLRENLLPACLEGEAAVSGYHADNVGPCLLGGITLITGTRRPHIRHLPVPDCLFFALVTPDVEVPTAEARAVLPTEVPLKTFIQQTSNLAIMIDALHRGDVKTVAMAMERDQVAEPARQHLMPLLADVRTAAKQAGAYAVVISGAGPTLCAVCDSETVSNAVAHAMEAIYHNVGIGGQGWATQVDPVGARILNLDK